MPLNKKIGDVVRQAEAAYAIRVTAAEQAGYGSGNWNYILTSEQGVFVLSIIEEQTRDEVVVMAHTLNWLAEHGYPSTTLRHTAGQELTTVIEGKPALLRRYLRGDVCWAPNEGQIRQVGASLAALHQIPSPDFLPTDIYYRQDRFTRALKSGHDTAFETWVKQSLNHLDIGSFANLPAGLIHADVFTDNVLFNGNLLVGIIDFELACNYLFAFDLAMAVIGMCLCDGEPCSGKIHSLIAGYESIRALRVDEIDAIKPLSEYAAIMTSVWRYWRYRCHEPHHAKRTAYKEMATVAQRVKMHSFSELR